MCNNRYAKSILQCLFSIEPIAVHGADVTVHSLSYDSREVQTGAAFFALPGVHTDGSKFIDAAIAKGAVAVIHEKNTSIISRVYLLCSGDGCPRCNGRCCCRFL